MDDIRRRDFLKMGATALGGAAATTILPLSAQAFQSAATTKGSNNMTVRLAAGTLTFHSGWCSIPDWELALEVDKTLVSSKSARIEQVAGDASHIKLHFEKQRVVWDVQSAPSPIDNRLIVRSTITNASNLAVKLGKVFLLWKSSVRGFAEPNDSVVYLPMKTGGALNQVKSMGPKGATDDIAIEAFNQDRQRAFQVGFVSFLRAKVQVQHQYAGPEHFRVSAWNDFNGWQLPAGASTPMEVMTVAVGQNPHLQLRFWADTAVRECEIPPREWAGQPNGWLGYSWVDPFYTANYQAVVLRNVKSIRERLSGYGIDYVWVSIGNLPDGQPGAWLEWNNENFPGGHRYLYDQLCQSGMKLGLWCGAFMLSSKLKDRVTELWDAIIKRPDGKEPMPYTPAWGYGLQSPTESYKEPIYALDPSHPKTLKFLTKVFTEYRKWGVRYYMVDFLWAGSGDLSTTPHAPHYDKTLVGGPEVLQKGLRAIRAACGDDTHLLGSTGPTFQTAGVLDAVRVGNDFGEGRPVTPAFPSYPATYALKPETAWTGPYHALSNQAATYFTHRKLYINNSGDVLTVDKPLQLNQAQINATVHAMSGGPSMLGDDITYIDDERLGLIKKTLPRPTEVAVPVDLFTRKQTGCPHLYHRRITKPWGTYDVLAVYNLEPSQSLAESIDLESLGLTSPNGYHVWEFWNAQYVGAVEKELNVKITPYSVKVYRLTRVEDHPVVIGTDMHLLMGEVEIDRNQWAGATQTLSGRCIRPRGERGSVFIHSFPSLGVVDPTGIFIGKDLGTGTMILRIPLIFDNGVADWQVKFQSLTDQAPKTTSF